MAETIAERLQKARRRADRSIRSVQQELHDADVPGSSYANVHAYFSGKTTPSVEFLQAAARSFGVRLEWLITGEDPMTEAERHLLDLVGDQVLGDDLTRALQTGSEALKESRLDFELLLEVLRRWIRAHGANQRPSDHEIRRKAVHIWRLVHQTIPGELRLLRVGLSMPEQQWASYKIAMFQALALTVPIDRVAWDEGAPEGRFAEMVQAAEKAVEGKQQKGEEDG